MPKEDTRTQVDIAKEKLAQICIQTEAFIKVPEPQSEVFELWGNPEEIEQAKDYLASFEMAYKAPGHGGQRQWHKVKAFDGRVEHRDMRGALNKQHQQSFQQFTQKEDLRFQANLMWLDDRDMSTFTSVYDSNDILKENPLNSLQTQYSVIIRTESEHRRTSIVGDDRRKVMAVYNRILTLQKELVSRKRKGIKATQCLIPSSEAFKQRVYIDREGAERGHAGVYDVPSLDGEGLPATDIQLWTDLAASVHKKYRTSAKYAVRSCINSIYASRKQVRMRVIFGDMSLFYYESPPLRRDKQMEERDRDKVGDRHVLARHRGQDFYQIDDFINKVAEPRTEARQMPIASGAKHIDFIGQLCQDPSLSRPQISWLVHFDFRDHKSRITLRLELEYRPSSYNPETEPPEVHATRWLKYSDDTTQDVRELLVVDTFDLENVGYRFTITTDPLYQSDTMADSLNTFAQNVRFRPSTIGLRFAPSKHVAFPLGNMELVEIREITILQHTYKQNQGTFEIRRIDTFDQSPHKSSSTAKSTLWSASYYYPQWHTLLDQFAVLDLGDDIDWPRDMTTFFPKTVDPDGPALPLMFKGFMKEVDEISAMLAKVIGKKRGECIE